MLNYLLKNGIFVFFISAFLIYYTFFSYFETENNLHNIKFYNELGTFQLFSKNSKIEKVPLVLDKKNANINGFFLEKLNLYDEIYFSSTNSYKKTEDQNKIVLNLKKGIFLININDLKKKYTIIFDRVLIEPKHLGKIFIDTREDSKPLIMSIDSISDLRINNLQDNKNSSKDILTKTFIYPHQYLVLDFTKNIYLKGVDTLKFLSSFRNGYIKDPIYKDLKILPDLSLLLSEEDISFLDIFYKNIYLDIERSNRDFNKYYGIINSFNYSGKKVVGDGLNLFLLNSNKKIIDYKNSFFNNLKILFNSNKLESQGFLSDMMSDLGNIKMLNEDDYLAILEQINNYYKVSYLSNKLSVESKINFLNLYLKSNNLRNSNESYFYIKDLYFNYDFGNVDNFNALFSDFLDEHSKIYSKISINKDNFDYMDSFLLFLNKVIKTNVSGSNDISSIDSILNILNKYFSLSNGYYFNSNLTNDIGINLDYIKNTGTYQNLQIIAFLRVFLQTTFFKTSELKDKYNDDFLELNKLKFDMRNIELLKSNLNSNLENINNLNNKGADDNNRFLSSDDYESLKSVYNKYFLAIIDHKQYLKEYSLVLDENKTPFEKPTKEKFIYYMAGFNGVDVYTGLSFDVKSNYYSVSSIYINGVVFSFDLYPFDGNKIENIYIDGKKTDYSFVLDDVKEKLGNGTFDLNGAPSFEFKDFFVNMFKIQ